MTPRSFTTSPRPASTRQYSSSSAIPLAAITSPKIPSISRPVSYSRSRHSHQRPSTSDPMETAQPPTTPTPKKGRRPRRRGGSSQRTTAADGEGEEQLPSTEDEEELFNLLGVANPPVASASNNATDDLTAGTPGVLNVARSAVDAAAKTRTRKQRPKREVSGLQEGGSSTANTESPKPGRTRKGKEAEQGPVDGRVDSEGEGKVRGARKTRQAASNASALPSGLSASRSRATDTASQHVELRSQDLNHESDTFETASLSQSLPTGGLFAPPPQTKSAKKGKSKKDSGIDTGDESAVWEMPEQAGSGASLTWQQKLQASSSSNESPRRSNKSTPQSGSATASSKPRARPNTTNPLHLPHPPSAMISSPLVPRPAHARRRSLETAVQPSAFDSTIPFHTGYNVNRAPQTPVKLPTSMAPGGGLPLLQGDFPRIRAQEAIGGPAVAGPAGVQSAPMPNPQGQGIKYAGPTFHNSPHGASLPKPDLEDF